ncbi:MAG TPA: preprotein translocase subunit YajC [Streptosporangiaceae bacterium]|nr:preprotein translocase subunit YajC [Streptosporangiaceae bacterium]
MLGNIALAASSSKSSGSSTTFLLIIVVLVVIFYFLMIRPQRNRARKVQEQQNSVQPGARVRTTAGMYATVTQVDGNDVVLEVAPGVEVRYLKRAIMEVVPDGTGEAYDGAAREETGTGVADDSETTATAEEPADGHAAADEKSSRSV